VLDADGEILCSTGFSLCYWIAPDLWAVARGGMGTIHKKLV